MRSLKSFSVVLQAQAVLEDQLWSYVVPNLPKAQLTNSANLVKCISFRSPKERNGDVILGFVDAPSNRVTWSEPLDRFVLLSLEGFRLKASTPSNDETCTAKEAAEYLTRLLRTGIAINYVQYHFFGHSNSQLKSRSCFLYAASKVDISGMKESMGDFSKLKSVGKKAKRIGLLFSSAELGVTLSPERCSDIEDVERGDYNFTDGCGLISMAMAKQLVRRRNIAFRNRRYLPAVYQIRYRGYKGVLTLDMSLAASIAVQFRYSMRKFKDAKDLTLSIVDYSKVRRVLPLSFSDRKANVAVLAICLWISE